MRLLIVTLICAFFFSCSNSESNQLVGQAIGFADGEKLLWQEIDANNNPKVIDTLTIQNGKFSIDLNDAPKADLRILTPVDSRTNVLVFLENSPLKATLYKDSLYASYVSGSRANQLYNEYYSALRATAEIQRDKTAAYNQARSEQDGIMVQILQQEIAQLKESQRVYKKQFINDNPNSLFTLMVLSNLLDNKEISLTEVNRVIDATDQRLMDTNMGKTLVASLAAVKATDVGGKAPSFSAAMPNGAQLSLEEAMGKYTLIDFWASWCKPCRIENPNLVRAYNEYHDKGFNIIGVSLDQPKGKERWVKAIADDGLLWPQVSNLLFWQDPIARQYGVSSIPASFLLDENGVIVAKNLRGAQLEETLNSLLNP